MKGIKELTLGIGDFNNDVGKKVDGFEDVHGGNRIEKQNLEGEMLLEICDQKDLCVANTWFKKRKKRKVTFSSGGNENEIDFVLVEKESSKFLKDVEMISWEIQHRLVVVDVKKENLFKHIKRKRIMQWRV